MIANINIDRINFAQAKILIVGDIMLDQYWYGDTNRISPEAPVPVVRISDYDFRLGGAANVAWNARTLGCQVQLLSVVGDDEAATSIENLLAKKDIPAHLIRTKDFTTIRKTRVLSRRQQMLRLDHEEETCIIPEQAMQELHNAYASLIAEYDAVIFSDYAKGIFSDKRFYLDIANKHNVQVLADPKTLDFTEYSGIDFLKPNLSEFEAVVGKCESLTEIESKGLTLLDACNIKTLVVTRGSDGVSVISKSQKPIHLPSYSGEVFDVTGAGDTFIATLAACLASKIELNNAARISSIAAAVVVGKVGTSTATVSEIKDMLHRKVSLPLGVIEENILKEVLKISKARGEKIVFVNGCYDILHYGHIRYLEKAAELGDRLIVAVNTDSSVKRLKGPDRPVYNENQRMEVLAGLKVVDWVVKFEENTPGRLVESLHPDILAKGNEHFATIEDIPASEGTDFVLNNGGEVHLIARTPDVSSTAALEMMDT